MLHETLLQRIRVCHAWERSVFEPWVAGAAPVGWVHRDRVPVVQALGEGFRRRGENLALEGADFAARSAAMARVVAQMAGAGQLRAPLGEYYAVAAPGGSEPLLQIDRCAVPWFGVHAHGVHLNGFVRTPAGLSLWIARRARGKRTFPGHLDNIVAGGQSIGMTPEATLVKECHEEAGLPASLARGAMRVGELTYFQQMERDLKHDTLVCFDLELPPDFAPVPVDGEVEAFELWPARRVLASLCSGDPWKPNCALVAIDFLLRHALLDGELGSAERQALGRALRGE